MRRVVHGLRGGDGRRKDVLVLVVGRHEDVDRRKLIVGILLDALAVQGIGADRQADDQDEDAIALCRENNDAERQANWIGCWRQRAGEAPVEITDDDETAERKEQLTLKRSGAGAPDDHHRADDEEAQCELRADADWLRKQDHRE